MTFSPADEQKR